MTNLFKGFALLCILTVLALGVEFAVPAHAQGQSGTTLTADVTANASWTRTFNWTINKSVTPSTLTMFKGDSGTVNYTVAVAKDSGTDAASISGQICVTNGGAVATENLTIVANLTMPPSQTIIASTGVDLSSNPVLEPGETGCYTYSIPVASPVGGATYKVTADVTITNHSGHLGTPFGPSPSATTSMLSGPDLVNDSINVVDSNGGSWTFNASGSQSYSKAFACNADAGTKNNTATISQTGQSASASVTVNCYELQVTKNAATSFTRTYTWTISKSADQAALTLSPGQSYGVNYTVGVDATAQDSAWAVSGSILITNPAPIAATLTGVSDVVSGVGAALVDCDVTFPYTLAAGGTLTCLYDAYLPDAADRTNTATATLQNTPSGTTDFSGTASVSFAGVAPSEVDECIYVTDSLYGPLGTVCNGDQPKTYNYPVTVGPYATCGQYAVTNSASFVTNDTGTTGSASWTVNVTVPCGGGCTLTPGYWKTHSLRGPAPYDDNWLAIGPAGADTAFFLSGQTYYQVLWTPPQGGNAYTILAHAYIAAKLNILNGASSPADVTTAISKAEAFFAANTPGTSLSKTVRSQVIGWAGTLDKYNNGLIGPGHCSE